MITDTAGPSQILSELIGEAVREHVGAVGVLVRDVPPPDPYTLLEKLKHMDQGDVPLRIAYLRPGGGDAALDAGFDESKFSTSVEQAEIWRNDRDLDALIVVVAHGDEPKLSSLEEFASVTSRDLKRLLVNRALGGEAGRNAVQERWWNLLQSDDAFGLGQLVQYYLALADKRGPEFLSASSRQIHLLGLLPDAAIFDGGDRGLEGRLDLNRGILRRIQTLTPKERKQISDGVAAEQDPESKRVLVEALDSMDRAQWDSEGVRSVSLDAAERLFSVRTSRSRTRRDSRPKTEQAVAVAAESLVNSNRAEDIQKLLVDLGEQLRIWDDTSRRPEKLRVELGGGHEALATARMDMLALVSRLLDDGVYGGLVAIAEESMDTILRRFDVEQHLLKRWERDELRGFLQELTVDEAGVRILTKFDAYDEVRAQVLPLMRLLAVEPLVAAAEPIARAKLLAFIDAYENLNREINSSFDRMFTQFSSDAVEILSHVLLLETIVVQAEGQLFVVLAPTHPLYIWHYAMYSKVVESQRDQLDEGDRDLVVAAARQLPNFLPSVFVPPIAVPPGESLPYVGRIGPVPYFGQGVENNSSEDGLKAITSIVESYLALEPHARFGLRIALVDPPDAGVFLHAIADLDRSGVITGAHVVIYRNHAQQLSVEMRLDEEDEDRVAQVFRSVTASRRYTLELAELQQGEVGPPAGQLFHVVVIFDCSEGRPNAARPLAHPIQPLAVPRRITYRLIPKTVELEPASGGIFDAYNQVGGRLTRNGRSNYLSVHQDAELRAKLNVVALRTPCVIIADRHVDRDLLLGHLRISTAREGERDIVAFSRSSAAFKRPLREVARNYNTLVSDDELDSLLQQLSELLEGGVVALRPDAAGRTNHNRIKGLLGTLIAARWFNALGAGSRLLVSLDSEDARRWLRLSADPLRADVVGFEWTGDHCTISVIEVKSVDASEAEYSVVDGVVRGPAIQQMLATRRLLSAIFTADRDDELVTTPARREILREHLYRELTKASYAPETRQVWADRLQRLLDGQVAVELRCHLVDVRLGVDPASLRDRSAIAIDGDDTVSVRITELNEMQIEALKQAEPHRQQAETDHEDNVGCQATAEPERHMTSSSTEEPQKQADHQGSSESDRLEATHPEPVVRPRALLGNAPGTYGKTQEVWFDPNDPTNPLPNPHVLITGETGSGKTQATKAILSDLRQHGIPPLILDFKDDYSDQVYAEAEGLRIYDPVYESLPFNPLMPPVDRRNGMANSLHHVHQLGDIVRRIYSLGDQQTYRLREAIKGTYEAVGIPSRPFQPASDQRYPTFNDVGKQLSQDKGADTLLGRLSPIFDLGLFETASDQGFAEWDPLESTCRHASLSIL